ncbi:MAG: hypothetical protein NVSMB64_17950 [Candidatus Velthaea sp.]
MILTPVASAYGRAVQTPFTVRLIGVLDRVLVEQFTDACAGLLHSGPRTLVVSLRDTLAMRDESLRRFVQMLVAYRAAGHRVLIEANAGWNRLLRESGAAFSQPDDTDYRAARRGVILAHSTERRSGLA